MARRLDDVMSHAEAVARLGGREQRKLTNNTYLRMNGKNVEIVLHSTPVVKITPENNYILNSGGWRTPTTKTRLNGYSPAMIYQSQHEWYANSVETPFVDGMVVDASGSVLLTASGDMVVCQ